MVSKNNKNLQNNINLNYSLNEQHKNILKKFNEDIRNLDENKKILSSLLQEYNTLNNKIQIDNDDINLKASLKLKIENLEDKIKNIENNNNEIDYFVKTNDLLLNYYDDDNNNQTNLCNTYNNQRIITVTNARKKTKQVVNIMSFFNKLEEEDIDEIPKNLIKKSKYDINTNYNNILNKTTLMVDVKPTFCNKCNCEKIVVLSDGLIICKQCGEVDDIIIESDIPNYKDNNVEKPIYPYKRINHLIEWLNQFQAKETTNIPNDIYEKILIEIKKMRITDINKITLFDIKDILKKLKLNQYYEHVSYIMTKLTGKHPPILKRETEEYIKKMFKEIQEPFIKHCPTNRTNFLNYSYVLHKIFQIIHLDEFLEYFPLLKSREKLRIQDEVWKKICGELNWKFYPSL